MERLVQKISYDGNAEFMAEHLKEYGWEYIVVDIQWYEPYAATNYLRCIIQI